MYEGMLAETVMMKGYNGDVINAYFARPLGPGPFPAMVLISHMPGWDEWYREATRRFAHHGYLAICPNIFYRFGHGSPEEVAARARAAGGAADDLVVGDATGARDYVSALPTCNGKIGVFGTCSGGRHSLLAACRSKGFSAVVDCWGRIALPTQEPSQKLPVEHTKDLSCPLLGLFGEEDEAPSPQQVAQLEGALKEFGKNYEFHMYPKAGHGFFYYDRPMYRQEQAVDGWKKVFAFLEKNLSS